MKKKEINYIVIFLSVVFVFVACNPKAENDVIISSQTPVSTEETLLSSLISVKRIVPLETKEHSLIGDNVRKILKYGDCYYVSFNRTTLLQFDINGRFLRQIGAIGSGPGEFVSLRDFDVTDDGVFIMAGGNVMQYTHEGEYVRTIQLDVEVYGAEITDDKILGFANAREHVSQIFDKQGKWLADYQQNTPLTSMLSSSFYFPFVDGKYIFSFYLVNDVLIYDSRNNSYSYGRFTDLSGMLTLEEANRLEEENGIHIKLYDYGTYIYPFNSNGHQLYFVTHKSADDEGILWLRDLRSGQCSAYDCNDLKNDLTLVPVKNFLSNFTRSDVSFLSYILPSDLKDALKSAEDTTTLYYAQMKALADSLGEEDNFVLIEYEFK